MTARPHNRVDLHTHTARSDGVLEPTELFRQMRDWGARLVAITDHDTLAGARELLAAGLGTTDSDGPRILIGVEINTAVDGEIESIGGTEERLGELHILGLGVDPDDPSLARVLEAQRNGRALRLERTLLRLAMLGMDVRGRLPEAEGGIDAVGRPHMARALVAAGHADSVSDAFSRYLVPGAPGFVRRQGIGPRAAIEAITAAGGIASLAHSPWAPDEPIVIEALQAWGLRALEVHYHHWTDESVERMGTFADGLGLLRTGGSDYHGDTGDYAEAQESVHVPQSVGDELLAALQQP